MAGFGDWIGRQRRVLGRIEPGDIGRLAATLDRDAPDGVPPLWWWASFPDLTRQARLGPDGHPALGAFLPPVVGARRMFAGGGARLHAPLAVDVATELVERIAAIDEKPGRSGPLVFVEVERRLSQGGALRVVETQTLVYRQGPRADGPERAPAAATEAQWRETVTPDPALLFRFSAATFNGHRIHYDRPYAVEVEGYPGLVVHGPFIALRLLEALARRTGGRPLERLAFRASRPLFDTAPFEVCGVLEGDAARLWAVGPDGAVAMRAEATLSAL